MAVHDDKMWVVGGCDPSEFDFCHNRVEYYAKNEHNWQVGPSHPRSEIYAGVVLGDAQGVYTFGGRGDYNERAVYRMRNGSWSFLGQMTDSNKHASFNFHTYYTSGKIVGDYAYIGEK